MSQREQIDSPVRQERPNSNKKAYRKPVLRHERIFETSALSCGKVQTTQGQCAHNRKVS